MRLLALIAFGCLAVGARADQEASNGALVATSERGTLYAKSLPDESYGSKGVTRVYRVVEGAGPDRLLNTYNWYAGRVLLYEELGGTIVRFGPWARGRRATADELAIAFYRNGRLLRSYSTLQIAGNPADVSATVSHYTVFGPVIGVRPKGASEFVFEIEFHTGRVLGFDLRTGAMEAPLDYAHADPRTNRVTSGGQPSEVFATPSDAEGRRPVSRDFTYIAASFGTYARSQPGRSGGSPGATRIYFAESSTGRRDELVYTFDWYSPDIQLYGSHQVVRLGGPHRGEVASADELGLAFYREGKLQKSYSTLALAGTPENVQRTPGGYSVIARLLGSRDLAVGWYVFEVETHDGRRLLFEQESGEIVPRLAYARAEEREFWKLRRIAIQTGIPVAKVIELYDYLRDTMSAETTRLLESRGRDAEPTKAAFRALGASVRARISETLGPVGGPRYLADARWWLEDLDRGSGVRFTANGYSSTSF